MNRKKKKKKKTTKKILLTHFCRILCCICRRVFCRKFKCLHWNSAQYLTLVFHCCCVCTLIEQFVCYDCCCLCFIFVFFLPRPFSLSVFFCTVSVAYSSNQHSITLNIALCAAEHTQYTNEIYEFLQYKKIWYIHDIYTDRVFTLPLDTKNAGSPLSPPCVCVCALHYILHSLCAFARHSFPLPLLLSVLHLQ